MAIRLTAPLNREQLLTLRAGDSCLLNGVIYTARDAAHKLLCDCVKAGQPLPFDIKDAAIYFVGPTPARDNRPIGSAGPTTAYRMDAYSPTLIELGLAAMIGKGKRSDAVVDSIKTHGAVYFGAVGGCGALLSSCIIESSVVAYEHLGAEAVRRLVVKDFPVTVIIDSLGNDLYKLGPKAYLDTI